MITTDARMQAVAGLAALQAVRARTDPIQAMNAAMNAYRRDPGSAHRALMSAQQVIRRAQTNIGFQGFHRTHGHNKVLRGTPPTTVD